jgi:hypothetical protein
VALKNQFGMTSKCQGLNLKEWLKQCQQAVLWINGFGFIDPEGSFAFLLENRGIS